MVNTMVRDDYTIEIKNQIIRIHCGIWANLSSNRRVHFGHHSRVHFKTICSMDLEIFI